MTVELDKCHLDYNIFNTFSYSFWQKSEIANRVNVTTVSAVTGGVKISSLLTTTTPVSRVYNRHKYFLGFNLSS